MTRGSWQRTCDQIVNGDNGDGDDGGDYYGGDDGDDDGGDDGDDDGDGDRVFQRFNVRRR